jgi:hypothetical protein
MSLPAPLTQEEVAHILDVLTFGEIEIEGRLVDASNVALRGRLELDDIRARVIYKPVKGERRLWDFPDGTLAQREAAAFVLSAVGGWNLVPPTVLREGPLGPGSVQLWVDAVDGGTQSLIDIVRPAELAPGWLPVFEGQLADGTAVVVAHADRPELASAAVFDVVINNADRKGSPSGRGPVRLAVGLRSRPQRAQRAQAAHRVVGMGGQAAASVRPGQVGRPVGMVEQPKKPRVPSHQGAVVTGRGRRPQPASCGSLDHRPVPRAQRPWSGRAVAAPVGQPRCTPIRLCP